MEQCKALIDQINNLFIVIGTIGTMGSTVMLLLADTYIARFSYQHNLIRPTLKVCHGVISICRICCG